MASEGVNRLVRAIESRTGERINKPPIIDFGQIKSDGSLKTNNFPVTLPKDEFVICQSVKDSISPGSRVLVVWIGDDACVIDKI